MLDGAIIIPLQAMLWSLLYEIAALIWIIDRALLIVAYFVMALTAWITNQVFAPLLTVVGQQTEVLVGPVFTIAILILGFTYIMAVFGRFDVVSLRSAVLWLLFASALYTFGPSFYMGMEDFRRSVGGEFYQAGVAAFNGGGGVAGLTAVGTPPQDAVPIPTDQLGAYLPLPSVTAVDGVDVALAYLNADGADMLASGGSHPIARLPWNMVVADGGGYFDPVRGPDAFASMTDIERQESIGLAIQGVARLTTGLVIALFAVVEQLVHFMMAASFAVAFFSMFIAVLFGFFIRTEPIAWSALQLIIELFIQTIINSLLMSLIIGFVLVGANTGNAILLLGGAAAGLWMAVNLLQGALKALMGASSRLYQSFATATGGNFATVGETNKAAGQAALGAATGAAVMAGGGSFLQAMGGAFGDSRTAQTMNYASKLLGGEDTLLGSAAQALGEGASARTMGGPLGGYLLGNQSQRERESQQAQTRREQVVGSADRMRADAVQDFRRTGDRTPLQDTFDPDDQPRVAALTQTYDRDTFDEVVDTVRRVRNANPDLPPDSPAFQREVRQRLPDATANTVEPEALQDFAAVFGAPAEPLPTPYQKALVNAQPLAPPAPADDLRDAAVSAYQTTGSVQPLTDAFTPDDANRLARLMDAYDDDDVALVIDAVRSARNANPDMEPASPQAVRAARQQLPARLSQMPSSDLSAFSRAFGASPTQPVIPDERLSPAPYIGDRDQRIDAAMDAFWPEQDDTVLDETFSAAQINDIATLTDRYQRDDFEAVVRAVRQSRTDDPDREPGSVAAVRATRKQLPDHLRQMPGTDLAAFSFTFGGEADTPSVRARVGNAPPPAPRRDFSAKTPEPPPEPEPVPTTPPAFRPSVVADLPLIGTPIPEKGIPQLGPARQRRLARMGITDLESLRAADPDYLSSQLRVSPTQVQSWQTEAGKRLQDAPPTIPTKAFDPNPQSNMPQPKQNTPPPPPAFTPPPPAPMASPLGDTGWEEPPPIDWDSLVPPPENDDDWMPSWIPPQEEPPFMGGRRIAPPPPPRQTASAPPPSPRMDVPPPRQTTSAPPRMDAPPRQTPSNPPPPRMDAPPPRQTASAPPPPRMDAPPPRQNSSAPPPPRMDAPPPRQTTSTPPPPPRMDAPQPRQTTSTPPPRMDAPQPRQTTSAPPPPRMDAPPPRQTVSAPPPRQTTSAPPPPRMDVPPPRQTTAAPPPPRMDAPPPRQTVSAPPPSPTNDSKGDEA